MGSSSESKLARACLKLIGLIFLCIALFISCSDDGDDKHGCFNQELVTEYDTITCPLVAVPVCACNNVTYVNACAARKDGYEVVDSIPCGQ